LCRKYALEKMKKREKCNDEFRRKVPRGSRNG
jgi:hypothetical protein